MFKLTKKWSYECTTKIFLGLQLTSKIQLSELKNIIFETNKSFEKKEIGKIYCASIHSKKLSKVNLVLEIHTLSSDNNFDTILKSLSNLKAHKHIVLVQIPVRELNNINSFEKFQEFIDKQKLVYIPAQTKPLCLIKDIYNHIKCKEGLVLWNHYNPIKIEKGKYFAKQLYSELYLDCIRTKDGYRVESGSQIIIDNEVIPFFDDNQLGFRSI